jgi:uncharacterized small protein (DUF1192 family)
MGCVVNVNVYVAELASRIGQLKAERADTDCPDCIAIADREIEKLTAELDGFIEFANGIYWPTDDHA